MKAEEIYIGDSEETSHSFLKFLVYITNNINKEILIINYTIYNNMINNVRTRRAVAVRCFYTLHVLPITI